jgi:hypothetical protein
MKIRTTGFRYELDLLRRIKKQNIYYLYCDYS